MNNYLFSQPSRGNEVVSRWFKLTRFTLKRHVFAYRLCSRWVLFWVLSFQRPNRVVSVNCRCVFITGTRIRLPVCLPSKIARTL